MKKYCMAVLMLVVCNALLTGCTQTTTYGTPSLTPNTQPTSRVVSPANYRGTTMMQSSTMVAPR